MNLNNRKASYYIAKNDGTFEKIEGYVMPIKFPDNVIRDIGIDKRGSASHTYYVATDIASGALLHIGESTIKRTMDYITNEEFLNTTLALMEKEFYQGRLKAINEFLNGNEVKRGA